MRLLTAIFALLFALPALAADPAGSWAVRSQGRVVMLLTLDRAAGGWRGTLAWPEHFTVDANLGTLSEVRGLVERNVQVAATRPDGSLDLLVAGTRAPDRMRFRVQDDGTARLRWMDFDADFVLDRAAPGERVIGFDPTASYVLDRHWPTNAEMTALFDADQKAREDWEHADHARIARDDAARRARARTLLDAGALQSGEDFYHAAFLFQHGDAPEDYLLAHALAMAAGERGRPSGWIAAATLDRYLETIGRLQIFGTQYREEQGAMRQTPVQPGLIPDTLRKALNVPALAPAADKR